MKRAILCLSVLTLLTSTACRKKGADSGNTGVTQAPPDSAAGKALSEMDQKLASGDVQAQLQVLNQLLQAWVMSKNSFPGRVEEFVKAKMIAKVPVPPAGKKFLIDTKAVQVVLADQ